MTQRGRLYRDGVRWAIEPGGIEGYRFAVRTRQRRIMEQHMFTLASGYDKSKNAKRAWFRNMTIEEAKKLHDGQTVQIITLDGGHWYNVKVNGAPKLWKRDPWRVEVPWKFGLYEYGRERSSGERIDGFPYKMERFIMPLEKDGDA